MVSAKLKLLLVSLITVAALQSTTLRAQQPQIPTLQVCNPTEVAAKGAIIPLDSRGGYFSVQMRASCNPGEYPTGAGSIFISPGMSDSINGSINLVRYGSINEAAELALHAILINLALGLATSALFLIFGRQIYTAMGGVGGSLEAALEYSNVVFAGNALLWLMNALASVIRGTGNMPVPALAVFVGVALLLPLSPVLIFGLGPIPPLGIAGAGWAVVLSTALTTAVLAWSILTGPASSACAWPACAGRSSPISCASAASVPSTRCRRR